MDKNRNLIVRTRALQRPARFTVRTRAFHSRLWFRLKLFGVWQAIFLRKPADSRPAQSVLSKGAVSGKFCSKQNNRKGYGSEKKPKRRRVTVATLTFEFFERKKIRRIRKSPTNSAIGRRRSIRFESFSHRSAQQKNRRRVASASPEVCRAPLFPAIFRPTPIPPRSSYRASNEVAANGAFA